MIATLKITLLLVVVALIGCGTSPYTPGPRNYDQGRQALLRKDYVVAYRFLEQPSPGTEVDVLLLMQQYPQLVDAGRITFSETALTDSIDRYGKAQAFKIEHSRLQRFAVYSDAEAFRQAADALATAFPSELATFHEEAAERARIAGLPDAEQRKHWAEAFRRSVEASTVRGVVASGQLVDLSKPGNTSGSNFGAAVAQAIYIDNVSWRNYRATTQIGAGILGALLGRSSDRAPTRIFQKTYFIRTKAGDLKRIDEQSSDPILYPIGACLEYREPFQLAIADQELCAK